ncbi:MAG: hypothetical protein CMN96_08410 [Synechococcus sp. MED850]|nr:hypothetical protein [Synechococcus sp. MED850]OUW97220.1 MAG: hypothetical protein CBD89_05910 [Cyanobacteria bacterium TMED229]
MRPFHGLGALVSVGVLVSSCSQNAGDDASGAKQAMFKTKAEAEAAAPQFGCAGAHKMDGMWMVCEKHDSAVQKQHSSGH